MGRTLDTEVRRDIRRAYAAFLFWSGAAAALLATAAILWLTIQAPRFM